MTLPPPIYTMEPIVYRWNLPPWIPLLLSVALCTASNPLARTRLSGQTCYMPMFADFHQSIKPIRASCYVTCSSVLFRKRQLWADPSWCSLSALFKVIKGQVLLPEGAFLALPEPHICCLRFSRCSDWFRSVLPSSRTQCVSQHKVVWIRPLRVEQRKYSHVIWINHVALSHMNADLPPVGWRVWRETLCAGSHMPSVKPHQTTSICMFVFLSHSLSSFLKFVSKPLKSLYFPLVFPLCRHLLPRIEGNKCTRFQANSAS